MKCPYCKEKTISPIKKILYTNIKCNSCGKIVHYSKSKRTISGIGFIIAVFFDNRLNTNEVYKLLVFFTLTVVLFSSLTIIPAQKDE